MGKYNSQTMKNLPEQERPYEKCWRQGAGSLTDAELLSVILRTGSRGEPALELSRRILEQFPQGGLLGIYHVSLPDLTQIRGIGPVKAVQLKCIAELSRRMAKAQAGSSLSFTDPETVAEYYMEQLRHEKREKTLLLLLDGKNRIIREHMISEGTVNLSMASSREIFIEALKYEAVYIILIHNHPSGDPTPSMQDLKSTKMIKKAGDFMEIPLLDHIIIGDCSYVSLREQNLF